MLHSENLLRQFLFILLGVFVLLQLRVYSEEEREKLWEQYREVPDKVNRAALSEAYLSLVETIAKRVKRNLPRHVDEDDLFMEGAEALVKVIDKFDDSQGFLFQTYASRRIEGAILDYLRKIDWVPRNSREIINKIHSAEQYLSSQHPDYKEPTYREVADYLGWTEEYVRKYKTVYNHSFVDYYDGMNALDMDSNFVSVRETIPSLGESPESELEYNELLDITIERLDSLTSEEAEILVEVFILGNSTKSVAEKLGKSKKTLESIITTALDRIRGH